MIVLRSRGQSEVHQMRYRGSPLTATGRLHGRLRVHHGQSFGKRPPIELHGDHLRTQQKHPHPQVLGASGLCVAFEAAGCFGEWKDYGNLTRHRSCLVHHFVVVDDCRSRRKKQTGTGKVKASERVDLRSSL